MQIETAGRIKFAHGESKRSCVKDGIHVRTGERLHSSKIQCERCLRRLSQLKNWQLRRADQLPPDFPDTIHAAVQSGLRERSLVRLEMQQRWAVMAVRRRSVPVVQLPWTGGAGYIRAVPRAVAYGGYNCYYAAGVYLDQGTTVYVVVQ